MRTDTNRPLLEKIADPRGKDTPLYSRSTPAVAAAASNAVIAVLSIPVGERWLISTAVITTPAGVTVAELRLDGVQTGQFVDPGSYSERNLRQFFGDYIPVENEVSIVASNSGAAAANPTIVLYGWREML
jgi:hypothetical protein